MKSILITMSICLLSTTLVLRVSSAAVDPSRMKRDAANQDATQPENGEADTRANLPYGIQPVLPNLPPLPQQQQPGLGPYGTGGPSVFGPDGSAYHVISGPPEIPMKVLATNVDCQKNYMNVYFQLSRPFFGLIYPYGLVDKCVLFVGSGQVEVKLTLSHDKCGGPPPPKVPGFSQRIDPVIEHRLMVQWDTDLVQEYDTDVLVICDRPADYNRTIKFDLASVVGENKQFQTSTHPGPQMWMEIQRGEGPKAEPLVGPVILGEPLTLVFTLGDDVFRFDSNVIDCWATDGNNERSMITWNSPTLAAQVIPRPLLTQIPVIENGCSIKPKLFGNFLKIREEFPNQLTTTQWVYFKAFRFPTTPRVLIQCDIQVCYEKCYPQLPCAVPLDPRSSRKRREANATVDPSELSPIQPERLTMFRAIEVLLPEDANMPMAVFNGSFSEITGRILPSAADCIATRTFYGIVLGLGIAILLLIGMGAAYIQRQNKKLLMNNAQK